MIKKLKRIGFLIHCFLGYMNGFKSMIGIAEEITHDVDILWCDYFNDCEGCPLFMGECWKDEHSEKIKAIIKKAVKR